MRPSVTCPRLAGVCLAFLTATPAFAASQFSAVAAATVDGQAPARQVPFSSSAGDGGQGRLTAGATAVDSDGPIVSPGVFRQAHGEANVFANPGQVQLSGSMNVTSQLTGNVGRVGIVGVGETSDVITVMGTPAQMGQHLTLNGSFSFTSGMRVDATGQPSAQFPGKPTSFGFADADSQMSFSMTSNGIAGGSVVLAQAHHGIDNETGQTFDQDFKRATFVPFSIDLIVGQPTVLSLAASLTGSAAISDLTSDPILFGDGDLASAGGAFFGEVHWNVNSGFLTQTGTRNVVHGLSLTSDSGFDWLGAGVPPPGVIPEPAGWALMIAGFGLAGGALRRRRGPLAA